uniref:envelope membrane protein n=1 Tax=Edaphochlamys debaryana TaxID=47281 RepID=UPI0022A7F1E3|nr:envelope membrane protein [Edaphochlamys debaryana]UZS90734.1 envelope membrane protein [Edaphochlamys debaryana]
MGTRAAKYLLKTKNKDISKIYQEKTIELATYYNNHSIEAITNFFADLLSLCTLLYLLITLSIQINITKSFLLEVFFGLDDSKKSLLILLITDLLVGYHSSNLWELFFEFIFNHYGIPESQTGIFLLVATLPVLLDVLFKYLIFRHLNRSSPATVATYQAIIE